MSGEAGEGLEMEVPSNSIVCTGLDDGLNKKQFLLDHFSQFGKIVGVNCSKANKYAIIHYTNPNDAKTAKESSGRLDPDFAAVDIFFSAKSLSGAGTTSQAASVKKVLPKPIQAAGRILTRSRSGMLTRQISTSAKSAVKPLVSPKLLTKTAKVLPGARSPIRLKRAFPLAAPKSVPGTTSPDHKSDSCEEGEIVDSPENQSNTDIDIEDHQESQSAPGVFGDSQQVFKFTLPKSSNEPIKPVFGTTLPRIEGLPSVQSLFPTNTTDVKEAIKPSSFGSENKIHNVEPRGLNPTAFEFKMPSPAPVPIQQRADVKYEKMFGSTWGVQGTRTPPKRTNIPTSLTTEDIQKHFESTPSPSKRQPKADTNVDPDLTASANAELQDLLFKRSSTSDERYRILEARDKFIRMKNPKGKIRVELAVRLIGTCPDMCPEKERYMREAQRQLSIYEMVPGGDYEVDHTTAVKAYSRSSADQEEPLSHELRSGPVLDLTINYLLHNIVVRCENEDENLSEWYNFVWDRTRSIRKDITQQQLCDLQAVSLMEKCARFHIFCSSRLCELDRHSFDPKLDDENLMKCLQSLEHMYADLQLKGTRCPNEPEFRSYQILMNLNEGDILWEIQQKEEWVLNSPEVQLALKIHSAIFDKNFVAFFRLVRKASFMTACILHRYFYQVRLKALRTIIKAHSVPPKFEATMSMTTIQQMLGYGSGTNDDFLSFCNDHGVICDPMTNRFTVCKKQLQIPETPVIRRERELIDSKLSHPVSEAINGSPLGSNPLLSYAPKSSFDTDGYLTERAIYLPSKKGAVEPRSFQSPQSIQVIQTQKVQPKSVPQVGQFGTSLLGEETELDGKSRLPSPFQSAILVPDVRYGKQTIEEVIQEKTTELLEQCINAEVSEIGKGAISTCMYMRQVEFEKDLKITSNWISAETLNRIEIQVLRDTVREVSANEINTARLTDALSISIQNEMCNAVISSTISEVCSQTLIEKQEEDRSSVKKATEKLNLVLLAHWFRLWRKNTLERKAERIYIAQKRQQDLENFPPTMILPISPEAILNAWSGCPLTTHKIVKRSSVVDVVGRSIDLSKSFANCLKENTPSVLYYFLDPLRSQLPKFHGIDTILNANIMKPAIFNIILMSEFGSLDHLANWFWSSVCADCAETSDPNVVLYSLQMRGRACFIAFQKFASQEAWNRQSNYPLSASGIIIFLRTERDKEFLGGLTHYMNKPASVLILNMSSLNEAHIYKAIHISELKRRGLSRFIAISHSEENNLPEATSSLIKFLPWIGSTLVSAELDRPVAFPHIEVLLRTLLEDVFPKCITRISCPSSLFAAHNAFIDKIRHCLITGHVNEGLVQDKITSLILEKWPELEPNFPPNESQSLNPEQLETCLNHLRLPTPETLPDSFHYPVRPGEETERDGKKYARDYVLGLIDEKTSNLNLLIRLDDLLSLTWSPESWNTLIKICQMYGLDCLESHLQNSKLRICVAFSDLQSLQKPIEDRCSKCSGSGRKRPSELELDESTSHSQPKCPRQRTPVSSLLNGLQDFIREVKLEKQIPVHPSVHLPEVDSTP